jgi:hypothetical protein
MARSWTFPHLTPSGDLPCPPLSVLDRMGTVLDVVGLWWCAHPAPRPCPATLTAALECRFNRDRFVLSNGHACALQYSMLHLTGFPLTIDDCKAFRQVDSKTPGHPENFATEGVEVATGPLGQGLSNAVGLALAEAHLAATFNKPCVLSAGWAGCVLCAGSGPVLRPPPPCPDTGWLVLVVHPVLLPGVARAEVTPWSTIART